MAKIKPLGDNVLIKPVKEEEVSKAGIILPDTIDKEKPEQGEIIAIGPGKLKQDGTRIAMTVKVGDIIVFKKYSPDDIKIDNEDYLIVSESDILGIIEK